jgi:ABC-type antimicrobial peptide transport system permease subunit
MGTQSLLILLRRFGRNKLSSFLNVAGLSIGIAVSLVIFMIISHELSIDAFHKNRDSIYRVVSSETYRDGKVEWDGDIPAALVPALRKEFPQVDKAAALWNLRNEEFQLADDPAKKFRTAGVQYVEPELFDIFDFPWLAGNPHSALSEPHTLALSKSTAASWFGNWRNAVGKTVLVGLGKVSYRVTGVIEDIPANSDLQLNVLCSYITFRNDHPYTFNDPASWDNFNTASQCFFLLKKGQSIASMNKLLHGFVQRHYAPLAAGSNTYDSSFFQPLKEVHFDDRFYHFSSNGFSRTELWTMGSIGAFILLMACVNFVNLSTAQSLNRGKEIGVKKVLGSVPSVLFTDFMVETGILVLLALLTGTFIAIGSWQAVTTILQKDIPLVSFAAPAVIAFLLVAGVVVTALAGFYPALILSRFRPITALKNISRAANPQQVRLRRGLIAFQFIIAQSLIVGTLIVNNQMTFFYHRPMGFAREAIAVINLPYTQDAVARNAQFKKEALRLPGVQGATLCSDAPSIENSGSTYFTLAGHAHPENLEIAFRYADSNYLSTFHIPIVAGRYPSMNDSAREVMLNEATLRSIGLSAGEVVGKTMRWSNDAIFQIVGVVKDFHEGSLKGEILPLAMFATKDHYRRLAVKINTSSLATTMEQLNNTFDNRYPDQFFDAPFLDDSITAYYHSEQVVLTLLRIFAALGIFISCLGLYGLVSFMAFQKTKEVGIRKVLGASAQSIVYLFSSEFTALIAGSFLIAAPLSYYFMNEWLQSFYYHIDIGWSVFAIALGVSVLIAWITVSYKAIRAATANPVKSLRTE